MSGKFNLTVKVQKLLFSINHIKVKGVTIISYKQLDSTNEKAKMLIAEKMLKDKTVIVADEQLAGKGQYGSKWIAEPRKNLLMSIVFRPGFLRIDQQFFLNMAISLACRKAINNFTSEKVWIKWPNDLILQHKKIGGILIEQMITGQKIDYSIIGIGINVNQQNFPDALPRASSLLIIENKSFLIHDIFHELLSNSLNNYEQLQAQNYAEIKQDYLNHLLGFGKTQNYLWNDKRIKGMIEDIDNNGKLMLRIEDKVHSFGLKDIEWIPESKNL